MKKIIFLLFLATCGSFGLQAQIAFEKLSHDFGQVTEGIVAEHQFSFKNTGKEAVVVTNVQASCGCTTPDWTRDPVMPGETGFVKASYNSLGRPGPFLKTITVTASNGSVQVLEIKGEVLPKEAFPSQLTAANGAQLPTIEIAEREYNFGKLEVGKSFTKEFMVKNTGKSDLFLKSVYASCQCVVMSSAFQTLRPGESGKITLVYTPKQLGNGEVITLITNAVYSPNNTIVLKGNVVESLVNKSVIQKTGTNPFE